MRSRTVALGIGSNLVHNFSSPVANLRLALREIKKISELKVLKVSSIYESDAQLPEGASTEWNHKYLNAVVLCEIIGDTPASKLLMLVKQIEKNMGRDAAKKWAPRVIDIDLLHWSDADFKDEFLQIPHLHLIDRPFALLPLLEVWPTAEVGKRPAWVEAWVQEKPFRTAKSHQHFWPQFVGILNITDDSFSDGGLFTNSEQIQKQLILLLDSGAEVIDIGAESTRPGATAVTTELETSRLLSAFQVVEQVREERTFKVSLDSHNAKVAARIMAKYQIDFLNDVTGFDNLMMQSLLKDSKAKAFVMHSLSIPPQGDLTLDSELNPCSQLKKWWKMKVDQLVCLGIDADQLIFDPGIGFGKTKLQSMYILNNLSEFHSVTAEVMIGHSRKSFQTFFSDRPAADRDLETALVTKDFNLAFIQYLRVHDIETQKIALRSLF